MKSATDHTFGQRESLHIAVVIIARGCGKEKLCPRDRLQHLPWEWSCWQQLGEMHLAFKYFAAFWCLRSRSHYLSGCKITHAGKGFLRSSPKNLQAWSGGYLVALESRSALRARHLCSDGRVAAKQTSGHLRWVKTRRSPRKVTLQFDGEICHHVLWLAKRW